MICLRFKKKTLKYVKLLVLTLTITILLNGCAAHLQGQKSLGEQIAYGLADILILAFIVLAVYHILLAIFKLDIIKFIISLFFSLIGGLLILMVIHLAYVNEPISLYSFFESGTLSQFFSLNDFLNDFYIIIFSFYYKPYIILTHIGLVVIIIFVFVNIAKKSKDTDYINYKKEKEKAESAEKIKEVNDIATGVITDEHFDLDNNSNGQFSVGNSNIVEEFAETETDEVKVDKIREDEYQQETQSGKKEDNKEEEKANKNIDKKEKEHNLDYKETNNDKQIFEGYEGILSQEENLSMEDKKGLEEMLFTEDLNNQGEKLNIKDEQDDKKVERDKLDKIYKDKKDKKDKQEEPTTPEKNSQEMAEEPQNIQVIDDAVLDFESPKLSSLDLNMVDDDLVSIKEDSKNTEDEGSKESKKSKSKPNLGDISLIKAIDSKSKFEKLINLGADVNEQDELGRTALHYLCKDVGWVGGNHLYLIRLLIENDIDVNCQDLKGNTALHLLNSARGNTPAAIKYLKINGAELDIRNYKGFTPYEVAERRGDMALMNLLQ